MRTNVSDNQTSFCHNQQPVQSKPSKLESKISSYLFTPQLSGFIKKLKLNSQLGNKLRRNVFSQPNAVICEVKLMTVSEHGGGVDGQYDGFAMSGTDFDCGFDICRKMDEMA